jgi:CRISPR-associated protein Cmr2
MSVLVFAIGPVQGFISQSRRTADGWVGSYLLSYLAGHALAYLEEQLGDANVIEPDLDVPMYEAIEKLRVGGLADKSIGGDTTIAALPNVMVLNVPTGSDPDELGKEAQQAMACAWGKVQMAVWDRIPDLMRSKARVQSIWNRQVRHHWECYWAWGKDSTEAFRNLAARKGLRDFAPVEERGDRCTVCAQREALWDEDEQEPGTLGDRQARDVAKRLWRAWGSEINKLPGTPQTLIQPDGRERVCAICLIKRLIPWFENPIRNIWKAGKLSPDPPSVFPSTSTMATVIYRTVLIKKATQDSDLRKALDAYFSKLKGQNKGYGSRADPLDAFPCWVSTKDVAVQPGWDADRVERLLRMDGDWYLYGEAVRNEELKSTLKDGSGKTDDEKVARVHQAIQAAYRTLTTEARKAGASAPPIYYAVLTMDGDKMGDFKEAVAEVWSRDQAKTKEVSAVLNRFAQQVPKVIRVHNGRTIYAGGDDVLALLPLDTALDAADALRRSFFCRFAEWKEEQRMVNQGNAKVQDLPVQTLSGSIVYAHHQAPLCGVLREGHKLLTEWAKKRAGRNALALQHYQRGGPGTTFAARWEDDHGTCLVDRLKKLIDRLSDRQVASRFLYGMQELAWMFGSKGPFNDPTNRDGLTYVKSLLLKSRLSEGKSEAEREKEAERLAEELLALCGQAVGEEKDALATEPLLMARFLAGGGREER